MQPIPMFAVAIFSNVSFPCPFTTLHLFTGFIVLMCVFEFYLWIFSEEKAKMLRSVCETVDQKNTDLE